LLHKLEFVPRSEADKKAGLVVKPLTMKGEQPGGASRGIEAWRLVLDNLPVPRPLVALGWVTGLFKLPGALLHRLLRRRGHYSRFFGFDQPSRQRETGTTGVRRSVDRMGFWAGQVLVFLLMLACGSQVLIENRAVPPWLKPESRPEWMTAAVTYPRLFQGWSMFAPEPPRDDGWIIVDGRTKDGRKLDPLTGKEPNFSMDLPGGPDFSAQWSAFNMRIHEQRFRPYLNGLRDYLKNLHEINGRPDDELVAFDVWYVSRITLPPGQGFTPPTYRKLTAFGHVKDSLVPQDKIQSKTPGRGAGTPARANQPKRRPAGARPISPARPRPSRAPKNEKQLTAPGPLRELR
jgi:hypothetical protein